MIPLLLAALVGGVPFLALHSMGNDLAVTLAAAIFAAVLFDAIRDTLQGRHDRLRGRIRFHEIRDNDRERRESGGRVCERCGDGGAIVDRAKREWSVCSCPAGQSFDAELTQGRKDIRAGRLHRWEDVRRG